MHFNKLFSIIALVFLVKINCLAQTTDTLKSFVRISPIFGVQLGNFKLNTIEQSKIKGVHWGLDFSFVYKRILFGCRYTTAKYEDFAGGVVYYHNMSVANPVSGYYVGRIFLKKQSFGLMIGYQLIKVKRFEVVSQVVPSIFVISNDYSSGVSLSGSGFSVTPIIEANCQLLPFLKFTLASYTEASVSKKCIQNSIGIETRLAFLIK